VFGDEQVSSLRYFATEWGVLWTYLRLLVLPLGQALLYAPPLVASPLGAAPLLNLAGLIALLGVAARLRRVWPALLFGLSWFFVALSVESSFIPLDPAFEHRLYVPMFGFACAAAGALSLVPAARARWATGAVVLLVLGGLTVRRNALWNDPVAFLEDNLARAPGSPRVHVALARAWRQGGHDAKAYALLQRSIDEHGPDGQLAAELAALQVDQGRLDDAGRLLEAALALSPTDASLWEIEGRVRERRGDVEGALAAFDQVARLDPSRPQLRLDLGLLHAAAGRYAEAEGQFRMELRVSPSSGPAHYNLGVALLAQGRPAEARDAFREAARLAPADSRPLYNAGIASLRLHDLAGAESVLPVLERLSAGDASALRSRIEAARAADVKVGAGSRPTPSPPR
jgi:Flp pilus assembly protein TadD